MTPSWPRSSRRFRCVVNADPVPQARPRVVRKNGKVLRYYPKRNVEWRKKVMSAVASEMRDGSTEPVTYQCAVLLQIFKKEPRTKTERSIPLGDVDNYAKAILDAMQSAGLLVDDKLVMDLRVQKAYSEKPHAIIEVYKI